MFKQNDHVIYPAHGVTVVEDIIEKQVSGAIIHFIKLNFLFKDMTILVPTYNVQSIGIRYPATLAEVEVMLSELSKKPTKPPQNIDFTPSGWNRRNKDYQEKIQRGNLLEIACIYRDLMHIAQFKDLSFGERSVLQNTEELIVQELEVVTKSPRDEVLHMLRSPFKQFIFHDRSFMQKDVSGAP